MNKDLRIKIIDIVKKAREGHIPSSFSIIDILDFLYGEIIKVIKKNPNSNKRDYFFLSKGHASVALFVVLNKYGLLSNEDLLSYGQINSRLGGHPDMTKIDFVEASTGSLGHGFPTAIGTSLGLKIKNINNKVYVLIGDGECHEGTIWESANIAANNKLNNICAIVDWNKSASQLMPIENLSSKWRAFGWNVLNMDGHSTRSFINTFSKLKKYNGVKPTVIIAKTIKGKGSNLIEGHGVWHHKIPNQSEYLDIIRSIK